LHQRGPLVQLRTAVWTDVTRDTLVGAISTTLPTQSRKTYDFASGKFELS